MSPVKSCCHVEPAKPRRFVRPALALGIVALGAGISLHLYASHVAHWWLPLVLLVVAHGAIISAMVWLFVRVRRGLHGAAPHSSECSDSHDHGEHGKVIRNPHAYDWLVRILTLGGEKKFREQTLDLADLQPGESVLDVGCGTGMLLIEAAKRVGPSGTLHGIEPSSEMVAHARRKAAAESVTAHFAEGSAERLPFPDASFDVVFCTMVLHHLPVPMHATAIAEMHRVLRPGGRIVIVDLDRPKTLSAALSLVTLIHNIGSHAAAPDWQGICRFLEEHGVQPVQWTAMWSGAVAALVGRRS
ncbi:MAG: methyltransferase domain-containing protein [Verrucomicrobia bacterium]|nr:methyltransferase domain-containing protein [Verrucomicrobiota bacterium]